MSKCNVPQDEINPSVGARRLSKVLAVKYKDDLVAVAKEEGLAVHDSMDAVSIAMMLPTVDSRTGNLKK